MHGIDASERAIGDARANAARNRVRGARFSAGDAEAALRGMLEPAAGRTSSP